MMSLTAGNLLNSENLAPKFDFLKLTRSTGIALLENFNTFLSLTTPPANKTRLNIKRSSR